eukprot:m.151817 g.151817  ORF g.151817 m.151817 type:complete len:156 (-) comp14308_c0_seq1:824-1291(-)
MLRAPELEPGIAGLRARVKHRAALVQAMLKRTSNHEPETSAPQVQLNTQVQSCRMCSRLAPAGKKLLRCARCLAVLYCSSECQKRDWKSHKSFCKMATTQRNDLVNKGSNPAKFNDVLAWYVHVCSPTSRAFGGLIVDSMTAALCRCPNALAFWC